MLAFPSAAIAIAYSRPGPVDSGATTAKQQVVVELILLGRRSASTHNPCRCSLDRQNHRRVVWRGKDMAAEAVIVGLPSNGVILTRSREVDADYELWLCTHNIPVVSQFIPTRLSGLEVRVVGYLCEFE